MESLQIEVKDKLSVLAYKNIGLSEQDIKELDAILQLAESDPLSLEDMWSILDHVWEKLSCDNKNLDEEKIRNFYSHPVWILNGLFIEQDDVSMQHRNAISDWVVRRKNEGEIKKVLDYGGGFGTVALLLAKKAEDLIIDVFEPHPNSFSQMRMKPYKSVRYIASIDNCYDCLISTDVLEHVPDPLGTLSEMESVVREGGYLVIANCFLPVIKCHLPKTFHLRYTFFLFARLMGFVTVGNCVGSHAVIYKKAKEKRINWKLVRLLEKLSRTAFPTLRVLHSGYRAARSLLK